MKAKPVKPFLDSKNFLLLVASVALIAVISMGLVIYNQDMKLKSLDKMTETLKTQSQKDDIDSIEKDTKETKLDDLDKETKDIEVEIDSAK